MQYLNEAKRFIILIYLFTFDRLKSLNMLFNLVELLKSKVEIKRAFCSVIA